MNKFIEKVIAITISIMLFISINSFAAIYPERKHERKFIVMGTEGI
jgi:hypothetical protein